MAVPNAIAIVATEANLELKSIYWKNTARLIRPKIKINPI
jgi:hypothetical protein